jgi:hypothetical protein
MTWRRWIGTDFSTLCYKKSSAQALNNAGHSPVLLQNAAPEAVLPNPALQALRRRQFNTLLMSGVVLVASQCALAPSAWAQLTRPQVLQLRAERGEDGTLQVSSQLRFELSSAVQDVLARGIAVHFVASADLYRSRWYWTDKKLSSATRQWRLAYQPLTRRWRVTMTSSSGAGSGAALTQNYDGLGEALAFIQRTVRWRVADVNGLSQDADYNLDYNFRLDASQLPRPFQIGALGESDWDISLAQVLPVSLAIVPTAPQPAREPEKEPSKELVKEPAREASK